MKRPFHNRASRVARVRRQSAARRSMVSPGARLVRVERVGHVEGDSTEPVATRPLVWNFSTFQPFNLSTSYYTHDGNKNVSDLVTSSNLSVAAHYEYAPFGVIIKQCGNNAAANRLRFSCEFAEDSTLTIYYNYRHCVAEVGRWIHREKCPRNP